MIVGSRRHPEVVATAGWCRSALIVESAEEFGRWLEEKTDRKQFPLTLVSQTTSTKEIWESAVKKQKRVYKRRNI